MQILRIKGQWYPQGSAAKLAATLLCQSDRYTLEIEDGQSLYGMVSSIEVSSRLGNIERKLTFDDGSVFATSNNDAVDALIKPLGNSSGFLHSLESKLSWVAVALAVTVFVAYGFFKWGVPWASTQIAHALPQKTNELIAANTLEFLDKYMFEESELDTQRQEQIRNHFFSNIVPLEDDTDIIYTLHFRNWNDGGTSIPNAFALPSGDIILTDKFVELSNVQQEMDSVLLHEMGHVAHRHSLQRVIQATFVTAAVMLIAGDTSGIADMGLGLGSLLVSSNYSRDHESEADEYAFKKMLMAKVDPNHFATIMARMTDYMEVEMGREEDEQEQAKDQTDEEDKLLDYLSTHPSTEQRIKQAQRYSDCFKQGLTVCEAVN